MAPGSGAEGLPGAAWLAGSARAAWICRRRLSSSRTTSGDWGRPVKIAGLASGCANCARSQDFGSAAASPSSPGRAPRPKRLTAVKAATGAVMGRLPGEALACVGRELLDRVEDCLAEGGLHVVAAFAHLGEGLLRRLAVELR